MVLPLRQRRRQETAREIQKATLELSMRQGLENTTTEEIAAVAGVSTRTFFNYFKNKEAAAIGLPPSFQKGDMDALLKGSGSLAADLKLFLDIHMETLARDEAILRMVGTVLRSNEKARGILDAILMAECEELTKCLCDRVTERQVAAALASIATDAIGRAIFYWEHQDDISLGAALDIIWDGLIAASGLLSASSEQV